MLKPTKGPAEQPARGNALSDEPYCIDIASIRRAFPPGIEVPPLLLDFAGWLDGRPWGSAGCFSLVGDFTDLAPVVDGSPLRDQFALRRPPRSSHCCESCATKDGAPKTISASGIRCRS
jgi:hypothetical protein